jgi:hypothetical protein
MENFIIKSSCHCGAIKLEIEDKVPSHLISCNCSFCRRSGALMAYFSPSKIKILSSHGSTNEYIWGDKTIAQVRCSHCGCLSHWRSLESNIDRMGINARLFENVEIDKIQIRHFDGADTWKYLD